MKQRAVLAHLALASGAPIMTGLLADDLWDTLPARPAHALQAHVSRLRAGLGLDIEFRAGGYLLPAGAVVVDDERLTALCNQGRELLGAGHAEDAAESFRAAESLWRGPALADLTEFPILRQHAQRLTRLRREAVASRIDAELAAGLTEPAIGDLRTLVEDDPLDERAWRQLMTALHIDGRQIEALDAFQCARRAFAEHLGSDPSTALEHLHRDILRGLPPPTLAAAAPASRAPRLAGPTFSAGAADAPLVGRGHELDVLAQAWSEAHAGLRIVTITGDPGIGKSRLAAQFSARLAADGTEVLVGRCDRSLRSPYRPFAAMLRAHIAHTGAAGLGGGSAELAHLVPELSDAIAPGQRPPPHSDAAVESFRMLDAIACWLSGASADAPICLLLDDLHWADLESILTLQHLQHTPRPLRVLLVITHRDREERSPDPGLADLERQSDVLTHLPLTGLDDGQVRRLVAAEFGRAAVPADEPLLGRVSEATGGNPLFAVELARHLATSPTPSDGDLPLPVGLRAVIQGRLDRLPAPIRERLVYASVLGQVFDPLVLAAAGGYGHDEVDELLQAAAYARLIEPAAGPRLAHAFRHDVVRATLYDAIAPLRRATMHLRIAEALERQGGPVAGGTVEGGTVEGSGHLELAHHYEEAAAGVPASDIADRAARYLTLAGDNALARRAPAAAVDLYRRASALLAADVDPGTRCDLLIRTGSAQFNAGNAGHRETLLSAAWLAHGEGDHRRLTAAAVANNRGWYSSTSEIDHERVAVIEAALAGHAPDDRHSQAQLLAAWAVENVRDPALRNEALARSEKAFALALELSAETGDEVLLAHQIAHRFSVLYASFSDPHECLALSERLYELAHRRGDPGIRLNAAIAMAQAALLLGDFPASDRALDDAAQLAERLRHPARTWLARSWQATRAAVRGDLDGAEALALESLQLGLDTAQPDALTWFAGQVFVFRAMAGRLAEVLDSVEEQVVAHAAAIPAWRAAYAYALAEVGRHDEARTIVAEFAERECAQLPRDMLWLHGMAYLAMTSSVLGDVCSARALYPILVPFAGLVANNGTIDAGPVDLHLGTLARLLGDRRAAATHLAAAADLCHRAGAPLWLERVRAQQRRLAATPEPNAARD